ncbi:acyl-CoA/acyl-ACP dehydrogenase [Catenulispora sp. NF23]|uniref:acyl-CoA dehydrogenase family protein n=1 Tax=Catenulispora pinistramenti TaxID=2705254 RepID=UPI001BA57565|nr:acyl-CoA dehydrogenase family protein [Catenulispora pinistramenti]MBS2537999.1 acyl-CoA/acyl-ACP dehydrogenase [Catenulispora pinistramenti]
MPWARLSAFPRQTEGERERGDAAVNQTAALVMEHIDPEALEREGTLPAAFTDGLRASGLLAMTVDSAAGGLGLEPLTAFRVIETAASRSLALAYYVGLTNAFGSGTYLPLLPEGPLRSMIGRRVAEGIVSAGADAEAIGTANQRRETRAVPVDDGAAYEITGEKVFIGNGAAARIMDVSATLAEPDGSEAVRLFFVEADMPGFTVQRQEFMGLHGSPIGRVLLGRVRVPDFHLMDTDEDGWRMRPDRAVPHSDEAQGGEAAASFIPRELGQLASLGRLLVIGSCSLATAKMCLHWSRSFVNRRVIDGRGLGEYDEIRRLVAETAADVFAIDSISTWALQAWRDAEDEPDLTAAKNLASAGCWRAVDRTVSLLGAEGYETAASKAGRGAEPLPVERFFRDARALRVAGGVDFMIDRWSAQAALTACHFGARPFGPDTVDEPENSEAPELDDACRAHLRYLQRRARVLARICAEVTRDRSPQEVFGQQRLVALIGRIGGELLGMSVVLGHAAELARQDREWVLTLADISCAASRRRLADLGYQLACLSAAPWVAGCPWPGEDDPAESPASEPDHAGLTKAWLGADPGLDFLLYDVITTTAPIVRTAP